MKRSRVLLLIATVLLAIGAFYLYGGGSVPEGQPAMVRLNPANFGDLKQAFNDSRSEVRAIIMLSPT